MQTGKKFSIPDHVPPELVSDYVFESQPGVDKDPWLANLPVFKLPPIFFSPGGNYDQAGLGQWVVTSAEILREIYMSPEKFSSKDCLGTFKLVDLDVPVIPTETDPPEHTGYRMILNRFFTPARLSSLEDYIRSYANELIDKIVDKGACEFDRDFATPFPVAIFLRMMRLPVDRLYQFTEWVEDLFRPPTMEAHVSTIRKVLAYLSEVLAARKNDLGDDLLSMFLTAKLDNGRPLTEKEILSFSFLVFQGGLDTVTATMSFIWKHLAENHENQALLRREPELMPTAVEELLRAFSIVPSMRVVVNDIDFHGVKMKRGDHLLLATPISARDDKIYENPNTVDLRRGNPRHLAFATGVHTCAGNNLARREIRLALERWLARIPTFSLDPKNPPVTNARLVYGVGRLPLIWNK